MNGSRCAAWAGSPGHRPARSDAMTPDRLDAVVKAVADTVAKARTSVSRKIADPGGADPPALEREQHVLHSLAWLATYGETLKGLAAWARRLSEADRFT